MPYILAIANETDTLEKRVALTPESAQRLLKAYPAISITVEENAGAAAGYPNSSYEMVGAKVLKKREFESQKANLHMRITPPSGALPLAEDGLFIGLNPGVAFKGTTLALEKLPRTSRAQAMDVLSSQANLAGYAAVLQAATHFPRLLPMLMTAAGSSRPAQVLVLGVGVAGLQAIATARRLGAQVSAYDVRPEVQEQILSLGAKPVVVNTPVEKGEGGYAKELSAEAQKAQQQALANAITGADIIITTAQVPGKPAPVLVSEEAVKAMKPAAVIVDMAAGGYNLANNIAGGNCPLSKANEVTTTENGVILLAPTNLASLVPGDASRFFGQNMVNLLKILLKQEGEKLEVSLEDELAKAMIQK